MQPENSLSVKILNPSRFSQCLQLGSIMCPRVLKIPQQEGESIGWSLQGTSVSRFGP